MHIIDIYRWHPARVNELLHGHWSKGAKLKKRDRNLIWGRVLQRHIPVARTKRVVGLTIVLDRHKVGRKPDVDSFFKSLCDALVQCKMLVDDSDKWCELLPVIFTEGEEGEWGTIICLQDEDTGEKLPKKYLEKLN